MEVGNKVEFFSKPEGLEEFSTLQGEVIAVNEDGTVNVKVTLDESGNLKDVENVKVLAEGEEKVDSSCALVAEANDEPVAEAAPEPEAPAADEAAV